MTASPKKSKAKSRSQEESSADASLTFEDALAEIESVVRDLEAGELGLQESLDRYEAGVGYLKQCHAALRKAERRIELLMRVDDDGAAETTPFDEEAMTLEEKRGARSRRRKQKPAEEPPNTDAGDDMDTQPGLF